MSLLRLRPRHLAPALFLAAAAPLLAQNAAYTARDTLAKLDAFALETYPALWKVGYRKQGPIRLDLRSATSGLDLAPVGSDESDAVLCALTALCFENDRLGRPLPSLPPLMHPEDSEPDVDPSEGWIYAPFPPRDLS